MSSACKCLFSASKTKFVWQAIAYKELSHDSSHPPGLFLERPINTYTAQELERLILRWKSAETGWKTDDGLPIRERPLNIDLSPGVTIKCLHLVKGGCWLLVGVGSGAILFYALDENEPTPCVLIEQSNSTLCSSIKMAVDVDTSSPTLAFVRSLDYFIEVWRVSLVRNTSLELLEYTLVAQQLKCLQPEPYGQVADISLFGYYLAYSVTDRDTGLCYVIIVVWVDLGETPSNFNKWVQPTNHIYVWSLVLFLALRLYRL
ncbi:hypothetical protein AX16_003477 [Volvariella volvacea WC 439]|nr:hypothetical protein AX16_003477 [Volvariella volvacea WC 439]